MGKHYEWYSAVSKVTLPDETVGYIPFKSPLPKPGSTVEQAIAEMLLDGMNPDELKRAVFAHMDLHFRAKTANKVRAQITAGKEGKVSTVNAYRILSEQAAKGNPEVAQVLARGEDAVKEFALGFINHDVDLGNMVPEPDAKITDTAWKANKRKALGAVDDEDAGE